MVGGGLDFIDRLEAEEVRLGADLAGHRQEFVDQLGEVAGQGAALAAGRADVHGVQAVARRQPFVLDGDPVLADIAAARQRRVLLVPFPWRLLWSALVTAEMVHLPIRFKSDSLISLVNQDPAPDFGATRELGVEFRQFRPSST